METILTAYNWIFSTVVAVQFGFARNETSQVIPNTYFNQVDQLSAQFSQLSKMKAMKGILESFENHKYSASKSTTFTTHEVDNLVSAIKSIIPLVDKVWIWTVELKRQLNAN